MTIGGQLSIIEVMIEEQKAQEFDWLEEQKCANRLLLTTATQQPVPDPDAQRDIQRRVALSGVAKLGGGYLYRDDAQDSQLQDLFGAQPRPPWGRQINLWTTTHSINSHLQALFDQAHLEDNVSGIRSLPLVHKMGWPEQTWCKHSVQPLAWEAVGSHQFGDLHLAIHPSVLLVQQSKCPRLLK